MQRPASREPSASTPDSKPTAMKPASTASGGNSTSGAAQAPVEEESLSTRDVRQRAVMGAAIDVLRGFGVRFLGLIGTLVLARLLTPHDFGLVAIGATFVTFANFVSDGGIGARLIQEAHVPTRADLQALLAFQLGLDTAMAVVVSVVLFPFGESGQ